MREKLFRVRIYYLLSTPFFCWALYQIYIDKHIYWLIKAFLVLPLLPVTILSIMWFTLEMLIFLKKYIAAILNFKEQSK